MRKVPSAISRFLMATTATGGMVMLLGIVLIRIVQHHRTLSCLWKPLNGVIRPIAGGRIRMYALLKHVGRKSGRVYETPLGAWPFGDGFILVLTYGPEADWCRNVLAAGFCTLKTMGHEYFLTQPEIIPLSSAFMTYPLWVRMMLVAIGARHLLYVHRPHE